MRIRPFDPVRDYPDAARVLSAAYPSYPFTPEALKDRDEREPSWCLRKRFVVEESVGEIIAVGEFSQRADMYAPGRFFVLVYVVPEWQGQGIGQALYAQILEALKPHQPTELQSFCLETDARTLRFLTERGFVETMRDGQATLDLAAFDFEAWPAPLPPGVVLKSYAQLSARPDFAEVLCTLHNEIMADVPPLGGRTPLPADEFARAVLDPARKSFEASFAALDPDGVLIVVSELRRPPDDATDTLWIGLTGVRRAWRGQGVGLALKLAAMRRAKAAGIRTIRTGNASDNLPILRLNERLGFVRAPWRILLSRTLDNS